MDTIQELGELSLATRLKRLSERLTKDVSLIYNKLGFDFEARWFPIFASIYKHSPISVMELAHRLGITHTAVNQLSNELSKKGYIKSVKGKKDERQRLFQITAKGKSLFTSLKPLLENIKTANIELLKKTTPDFISSIEIIEKELDERSMFERIWLSVNGSLPRDIIIHDYSSKMKKHFKRLNYEWLEEFFSVEVIDKKILDDPNNRIIKNGGSIFFAEFDNKIVGTCALIKHENGSLELAKMAVSKKYRGRKIGEKLLLSALNKAKVIGFNQLFLLTSEKLIAANSLYLKLGFKRINHCPIDSIEYKRKTYAMVLDIK